MDKNTLYRKMVMERYQVLQFPNKMVKLKLPGKLVENRWRYRDNPWNGIGEKEYVGTIRWGKNTTPWERGDEGPNPET